MDYESRIV